MDELNKQLAELSMLNNTDLPPNPHLQHAITPNKKIGPAVPPKPKKQQPLVKENKSITFYF